jgi:hypothetical protein
LKRSKEVIGLLYKATMVSYGINFFWKVVVIFEILVSIEGYLVTVKEIAFIYLNSNLSVSTSRFSSTFLS